MTYPTRP